jgi:hypothetical protein
VGFNGGQLLYLALGGGISNDLFREAAVRQIRLTTVRGAFSGDPAVSDDPNSVRRGTPVTLGRVHVA